MGLRAEGDVAVAGPEGNQASGRAFGADIETIRTLAGLIPGALPVALNAVRVAASVRPKRVVVEGGDDTPVVMPRTAFQIVFPAGTVMLDSGLDEETHASFGKGEDEPYFPERFARLRTALDQADAIILTHYHADHVAGVVRSPNFAELARKTVATRQTLRLMIDTPHRPELKLSEADAARFVAIDYDRYLPVAPGTVLIKAPGHSPDHQMVYVRMQTGQEFLHSVDVAWTLDNILQVRGKAAPWVREDVPAVLGQLAWLKALSDCEPDLTILVTHDDALLDAVADRGLVGDELVI